MFSCLWIDWESLAALRERGGCDIIHISLFDLENGSIVHQYRLLSASRKRLGAPLPRDSFRD